MSNGLSRLQSRFLAEPARVDRVLASGGPLSARETLEAGLATVVPDEID